jgi:hypothetical protein
LLLKKQVLFGESQCEHSLLLALFIKMLLIKLLLLAKSLELLLLQELLLLL